MQLHFRLSRRIEGEDTPVATHHFPSDFEVPTLWLDAPTCLGVFHTPIEIELLREIQEKPTYYQKAPIIDNPLLGKPGKCGICKTQYENYETHIESEMHAEHVKDQHEAYTRLDELIQEYRAPATNLAPIFLQNPYKRKSAPQPFSKFKMAKTICSPNRNQP